MELTSGGVYTFIKNKKDLKTQFRIQFSMSAVGPYISYTGVKGQ